MSDRSTWDRPQRSVVMPPPSGIAAVIVIGLFAVSLCGLGILHEVFRRVIRK